MVWYLMISYDSIAFYDVGFGARSVSRKTPIYFILHYNIFYVGKQPLHHFLLAATSALVVIVVDDN